MEFVLKTSLKSGLITPTQNRNGFSVGIFCSRKPASAGNFLIIMINMSAPKIKAKFRIKEKVPFSIETLSGKMYRCGVCGKVFFTREGLEYHLSEEKDKKYEDLQFPQLDRNISINVIYSQDIRDLTNPKYPKLQKGDKLFTKSPSNNSHF